MRLGAVTKKSSSPRRADFITRSVMTTLEPERDMSISTEKPQGTMPLAGGQELRAVVFNLPNQLTWLRLALTLVMFCLIADWWVAKPW